MFTQGRRVIIYLPTFERSRKRCALGVSSNTVKY